MSARVESGFVPLPKVEQEQPEDRIRITLNLPGYVDQDRIGVNLTGISKLCRLGGIRQLVVLGKTDEETSHVIPEVSGMNSDGSAMASKKMAKVTVPTFESSVHDYSRRNKWIGDRWITLNVNMNVDEIGLRVSENEGGVHSPKNWARELDKGLRTPIRKAGDQNLLHDLESSDKNGYFVMAYSAAIAIPLTISLARGTFNPELGLVYLLATIAGNRLREKILTLKDQDHRFALFPGFQVDRAIALGITSRTRNLIKDLSPEKK
jgi:hypothetical protein